MISNKFENKFTNKPIPYIYDAALNNPQVLMCNKTLTKRFSDTADGEPPTSFIPLFCILPSWMSFKILNIFFNRKLFWWSHVSFLIRYAQMPVKTEKKTTF